MGNLQVWYCDKTKRIYESQPCRESRIMFCPEYGGMWIDDCFINNPDNGWVFLGDL